MDVENQELVAKTITCNGQNITDKRITYDDVEGFVSELNLDGCGLKEIPTQIDLLPNLRSLTLNGNEISNIRQLDKNKDLQNLELDDNRISKIENVEGDVLQSLGVLQLSGNNIGKIE